MADIGNKYRRLKTTEDRTPAHNSTFAIGGVSCSADSLVVAESFLLRINISGKNPAHRKSANRWRQLKNETDRHKYGQTFGVRQAI